jgi:acyl-CoA synthetase (AMP-forming)/AMP-acid ligase II
LLPNEIDFAALILVAANTGVALVPLSPTLPAGAVESAFKSSDVKHVVAHANILRDIKKENMPFADGLWLSLDEETENAVSLQSLMDVASDAATRGQTNETQDAPTRGFTGALSETATENAGVTGGETLILTLTSGSTDKPKPIVLTQKNKLDRAFAAARMYGVTEDDTVLAATPLYHSLAERLVLMPLLLGGTSVIMPRFTPTLWFNCVKEHKVTFTISVSSQLAQIAEALASPFLPEITSLRCVVSSSALLEPHIKSELLSKLQCPLHECYGTSEVAIATNINMTDAKKKFKSVGNAAPDVDVKIVGEDGGVAKPGEKGEIICKTPLLFGGYYKLPEMTAACMRDGYFRTGDVGYLDDDGYLYYVDRLKDLIITGAINVYPNDIESAISELPSVRECAAFPLPDDRLGETVAVAIVPADKEGFSQRAVKLHCAKRLADYQQPREYFILDELPKNNMGKLMKRVLVNQILQQRGKG